MEYYSSLKKKEILPFATIWMDLEGTVLSEISQTRQILHDTTYMWNLKKKAKLIETETSAVVIRSWKVGKIVRCWSKSTNLLEDE